MSYAFFHLTACNSWRCRWRNCWWNIWWKWLKGKSQYKCFYLIFTFSNLHTLPSLFLPNNSSVCLHLIDKQSANLSEIYFFMYASEFWWLQLFSAFMCQIFIKEHSFVAITGGNTKENRLHSNASWGCVWRGC